MRNIYTVLVMLSYSLLMTGQNCDRQFIQDTINIENYRVFLSAPKYSIDNSSFASEYHGSIYVFPLSDQFPYISGLVLTLLHMTQWDMAYASEFDLELWNTITETNSIGSRCYIKDGLFSRIDIYKGGIVAFYSNMKYEKAMLGNEIINTIRIVNNNNSDITLKKRKNLRIVTVSQ